MPLSYQYHNAPIPGGGFVTGLLFHPTYAGVIYCRTDIGGVYRYLSAQKCWHPLVDSVTQPNRWATYPLSIAISPFDAYTLYVVSGDGEQDNYLSISHNQGDTFTSHLLPTGVHGNASGRGTGERLIASFSDTQTLYFASQTGGLLVTHDLGYQWQHVPVTLQCGQEERNLAFLFLHPQNEQIMVIGTNGAGNSNGHHIRGASLYITTDGGAHFDLMPGQPKPIESPACTHPGYVAQRYAFDGRYLYVPFSSPGNCWMGFDSYACDTGSCFDGVLLRYELDAQGHVLSYCDVTPQGYTDADYPLRRMGCGLSGISVDTAHPGTVILTTICHPVADTIYFSTDYGIHFVPILCGLHIGKVDWTVPYMRPVCNGGQSILHWLSDIQIDPFSSNTAMVTSGTGIFATFDLLQARQGNPVHWQPLCRGLEETVHLNVYSPSVGAVQLIDIVGDLGGFAFSDITKSCENSFADAEHNRYITCINADYPEVTTSPIIVTARGNWTGKTTGGLIYSDDECLSWKRLPDPVGISPLIDTFIRHIQTPNVNAGWAAISADGHTILWSIADGNVLPIPALVHSQDHGMHWAASIVLDLFGNRVLDTSKTMKILSDRNVPHLFYGFGEESQLYVSFDRGYTFRQYAAPEGFPTLNLSGIDSMQHYEIRVQPNTKGIVWLSLAQEGLWKLLFSLEENAFTAQRVSHFGDTVYRVGLGKSAEGSLHPTLYINGILSGTYGFYRSLDEGATFERVNDDQQMFGDIRSIAGDPRIFGRFYIATGTRGVLYAQPKHNA